MTTQQTIDDANNKLVAAQNAYNSAVATEQAKFSVVNDWYNLVVQCNANARGVGNTIDRNSCSHKSTGPCQSVGTCQSNVDTYNGYVSDLVSATSVTAGKKSLLDTAIAYKNQVLANAQNDPTFIAQQQQNQLAQTQLENQKSRNRNIIIAITVIIVIIIISSLIWKKI